MVEETVRAKESCRSTPFRPTVERQTKSLAKSKSFSVREAEQQGKLRREIAEIGPQPIWVLVQLGPHFEEIISQCFSRLERRFLINSSSRLTCFEHKNRL